MGTDESAVDAVEQQIAVDDLSPRRGPQVERILAGQQPLELAAGHARHLLGLEPGLERAAQAEHGGLNGGPVRSIARPQDPARRHQREQAEKVDRAPPRGVEEHVRMVVEPPPDPGEVADPGMGEDGPRVRKPLGESEHVAAERGDPATGVDDDRQPALLREREDQLDGGIGEREALGSRMQLEPARPAARHRSASATGPRPGSSRQKGTSFPSDAAASARTRSLASS